MISFCICAVCLCERFEIVRASGIIFIAYLLCFLISFWGGGVEGFESFMVAWLFLLHFQGSVVTSVLGVKAIGLGSSNPTELDDVVPGAPCPGKGLFVGFRVLHPI